MRMKEILRGKSNSLACFALKANKPPGASPRSRLNIYYRVCLEHAGI